MSTARFQPLDLSAAPAGAVTGVERTSWMSSLRERGIALGVVVLVHAALLVTLTSSFRPHRSSAVPTPIEVRLIEPVATFREPVPLPPIPIEPPPLESLPLPQLSIDVSPSQAAITVPVQSPPGPPRDAAPAPDFTPPQFNAAYLTNPAPTYPPMSRRLREEGTVVLRVRVTAGGQAEEIQLEHTSGFARLDEAAAGAVKRWRFVPARRGEQLVEAWVLVPVEFVLNMRALAAPSRRS